MQRYSVAATLCSRVMSDRCWIIFYDQSTKHLLWFTSLSATLRVQSNLNKRTNHMQCGHSKGQPDLFCQNVKLPILLRLLTSLRSVGCSKDRHLISLRVRELTITSIRNTMAKKKKKKLVVFNTVSWVAILLLYEKDRATNLPLMFDTITQHRTWAHAIVSEKTKPLSFICCHEILPNN